VPHPAGLPDLFLDRSLGRLVPELLRAAVLRLITLAEQFGIPADEAVRDEEWLDLAGTRGWVVFMKDTRIRYRTAERASLIRHDVRCFCRSSQNLGGVEMANRFIDNLDAITRACLQDDGPFIYAVHRSRIERLAISPA
jgi:hypothetical protein